MPAPRRAIAGRADADPAGPDRARGRGKSLPNAIAEVREAVDFLRYYADQADREFSNDTHRPLGTVLCISPWNFPLAISLARSRRRWPPAIPCRPSRPSRRR